MVSPFPSRGGFCATAGTARRLQTLEALLGRSSYRNKDLIEARPVGISDLGRISVNTLGRQSSARSL